MLKSVRRAPLVLFTSVALATGGLSSPAAAEDPVAPDAVNEIVEALEADAERGGGDTAALPACTGFTLYPRAGGVTWRIPSVGMDSGQVSCQLKLWDYNNWGVLALQQWLLYCNNAAQINVDGDYGPITRDVVMWLEAGKGLPNDGGVYTTDSWRAISVAELRGNDVVGCTRV